MTTKQPLNTFLNSYNYKSIIDKYKTLHAIEVTCLINTCIKNEYNISSSFKVIGFYISKKHKNKQGRKT